jgi:hypothetical protein
LNARPTFSSRAWTSEASKTNDSLFMSPMYSLEVESSAHLPRTLGQHAIPSAGALVLLVVFMGMSLLVLPELHHLHGWSYTMDIWNYFQVAHLADIGAYPAVYGQLALNVTPGIIVALGPVWSITHAAGMTVAYVFPVWHPTAWLVLGPYEVVLSVPALFAVDAVAVRLGASPSRRLLICAAEVYVLYNVVMWGHPEDAVAVACLLYACLAASEKRWSRFGWLFGTAVAFQPVVLLALPLLLLIAGWRRLPGLLARIATPTAILLVLPLTMNWSVTMHALTSQATYPTLNRPTPWLRLAPSLGHEGFIGVSAVAAAADGPSRLLAILFSFILAIFFRRAAAELGVLIAAVAIALSLWCDFETVIAPYYVWPTIAVALIGLSTTSRMRSVSTLIFAILADLASNADLHAEWMWWMIVCALGALLAASWPRARAHSNERVSVDTPRSMEMLAAKGRSSTDNGC